MLCIFFSDSDLYIYVQNYFGYIIIIIIIIILHIYYSYR